jgi:hypothetical protein
MLAALAAPCAGAGELRHHYECRVTSTGLLPRLGASDQPLELSHFTCRVTGGLLEGFVATGTNILERLEGGGRLVGSIVVAQKGASTLVYEVSEGTRRSLGRSAWESTGAGVYKSGSGVAAALVGRSFRAQARSRGPSAFTIDVVVAAGPAAESPH